ncbi:AbrB family transcriptional regulator [Roseomonas aeriglobus]|nr:AbrB family transcriptional regulator [Roseomonas aeriglobus]
MRRWALLGAASVLLALVLDLAGLPAAWLLAPMLAAIAAAVGGMEAKLPGAASTAAQALIGCLIAHAIAPGIFATLARDWALFLGVSAATIAASGLLGYLLAQWRVVPGTVAIWGSSPGGATAMVIMAQAWGADARLVAVMVYLRVVMVAALASAVALAFTGHVARTPMVATWSHAIDPAALALTAAVASAGALVGRWSRLPAGALMGAMAVGALLNLLDVARVSPSRLLMIPAYIVIGWRIGLGFTRETLSASARALPRLALASATLLAFGAAMAWLLVRYAGVDPLTAYLATSPGGMDAVAVIASTSAADAPFVMALQVVRFLMVMAIGPALATRLAARSMR